MSEVEQPIQPETTAFTGEVAGQSPEDPNSKKRVIEVPNLSEEDMATLREHISSNYDFNVDVEEVPFNFKKSTDKVTGIETERKSVILAIPYPSMDGMIAILEKEGKQRDLLFEAVRDVVNAAARDLLYEDVTLNAESFPVDKVSWEAIANLPKAARRGGGIAKETWEAFAVDYCEVMPAAAGKSMDQVGHAAKILLNKLSQVKTNIPVLNVLVEQIAIYADASPSIDEYRECVEFLLQKADTFLNITDEELLANL